MVGGLVVVIFALGVDVATTDSRRLRGYVVVVVTYVIGIDSTAVAAVSVGFLSIVVFAVALTIGPGRDGVDPRERERRMRRGGRAVWLTYGY
jgi:uncharacterized protein HemY